MTVISHIYFFLRLWESQKYLERGEAEHFFPDTKIETRSCEERAKRSKNWVTLILKLTKAEDDVSRLKKKQKMSQAF